MKPKRQPLVSVIMPVYNAKRFLLKSLESVIKQTYQNIEIICVDDGSTDNSYKILQKAANADKRIKIFRLPKNNGAATAANIAVLQVKGHFIARMDADDIMLPYRIEKQVKYLQTHPQIIAVGGQCIRINAKGDENGIKRFPLKHKELSSMIFRASPIQQPTIMINRQKLPHDFPWYRSDLAIGEDYDLYYKLMKYGHLANLSFPVIKYREHPDNLTLSSQKRSFYYITKSRLIALTKYGYRPDLVSLINVALQTLLVLILPDRLIYPIHLKIRELSYKFRI